MSRIAQADALATEWIVWLHKVRRKAENTWVTYLRVLVAYIDWCEQGKHDPFELSVESIQDFIMRRHPRTRKQGSAATQRLEGTVLRSWFKWMTDRRKVDHNPTLDLVSPSVPFSMGDPIKDEHWQLLWDYDHPPQMRSSLGSGYYGALRVSEMLSVGPSQITDVFYNETWRKGGFSMDVPWWYMAQAVNLGRPDLLPDPKELLYAHRHTRNRGLRLLEATDRRNLNRYMLTICHRLNIPDYTPQQLRHSAVTNLLGVGMPEYLVMRAVGHKSFNTTMRYAGAVDRQLRMWLDSTRQRRSFDGPKEALDQGF